MGDEDKSYYFRDWKRCPVCNSGMFLITHISQAQFCRDTSGNIFGGYEDPEFHSPKKIMEKVECKECRTTLATDRFDRKLYRG